MQEGPSGTDQDAVETLSRDRLNGYAHKDGKNRDADLLGRYLFNLSVSGALYPFLHVLEVLLRNRIHQALSAARPIDSDLPNLYDRFPCWLDEASNLLLPEHRKVVEEAKRGVQSDSHAGTACSQTAIQLLGFPV